MVFLISQDYARDSMFLLYLIWYINMRSFINVLECLIRNKLPQPLEVIPTSQFPLIDNHLLIWNHVNI
jgi:hypothetical protein